MEVIEYLRALPENSGQKVKMSTSNGDLEFYFLWFYNDENIDLRPLGSEGVFSVNKNHWNRIELVDQ